MAAVQRQQNALDTLEASLNSIVNTPFRRSSLYYQLISLRAQFLQIGATFSSPANFEAAQLPRAKAQLQQTLPKEKLAFDDALDQLEYELVR